ncbi:MAG: J domain-containing protein [Candidatus Aerophobetes bacterium]|nr:J domain-containing protein [Candidatus Aerophobetes bacterium]
MDFPQINEARKLLSLSEEATLKEIKEAYRELAKKYHPDGYPESRREECKNMMVRINQAYKTLLDYINCYKISFKREEVERNNPERDMERFRDDWLVR